MDFSRDLARVTHTYDFITAVHYLQEQHPGHTLETVARLMNDTYYVEQRGNQRIRESDIYLAHCIIHNNLPPDLEGQLFFAAYKNLPTDREDYRKLNYKNYRCIKDLGKVLRFTVKSKKKQLKSVLKDLQKIEDGTKLGSKTTTLGWWLDQKTPEYQRAITTARHLLLDGKRFKLFRESLFWFMGSETDDYPLPLEIRKLAIPGQPNAVRVYLKTKCGRLSICSRASYLLI